MFPVRTETSPTQRRQELIEKYWAGDMARKVYLLRRQRKEILERCRRIAVIGASADPDSESYITMEKLLGLGLEIIPVFSGRESLLGLRYIPGCAMCRAGSIACKCIPLVKSIL
jgi:hypothetical protein